MTMDDGETEKDELWETLKFTSQDGLQLSARIYENQKSNWSPIVCLPGLTRNASDFDELATYFSRHKHRPRQVISLDYRGRGASEYDPNPQNYTPLVEIQDILAALVSMNIEKAIFLGTSRGGILAMILAVLRPGIIAGTILNDIGPEIDVSGLARLKTYIGHDHPVEKWQDAIALVKLIHGRFFPDLTEEDWDKFARTTFEKQGKVIKSSYDPRLARMLDGIESDATPPTLWAQYRCLSRFPVLAIRGGLSDILSEAVFERMYEENQNMESITVERQGHAPLLSSPKLLNRISGFVSRVDDQLE
ncbi:MAG: alpha/beta hydrolase [Hyphomicrobiales bacterium]|nr:MAG: alpha/beta hydrolase [Hyphomicrobiales bacterium]